MACLGPYSMTIFHVTIYQMGFLHKRHGADACMRRLCTSKCSPRGKSHNSSLSCINISVPHSMVHIVFPYIILACLLSQSPYGMPCTIPCRCLQYSTTKSTSLPCTCHCICAPILCLSILCKYLLANSRGDHHCQCTEM